MKKGKYILMDEYAVATLMDENICSQNDDETVAACLLR
jgi:hypothetical protein